MGCRREKDVLGNRQGLMLKDPGARGETIHDLESKDPQTDLKPQKYHNHICVLGGQWESGGCNSVSISHSRHDGLKAKAPASDANLEDGSGVTCMKTRTKPGLSSDPLKEGK